METWTAQERKQLRPLAQNVLLIAFCPFICKLLYPYLKAGMVEAQKVPYKSQPCHQCISLHAKGHAFTPPLHQTPMRAGPAEQPESRSSERNDKAQGLIATERQS